MAILTRRMKKIIVFSMVSLFMVLWVSGLREDQMGYVGDFEYRFMTLEDAVAGNDRYQVVYYWAQEK